MTSPPLKRAKVDEALTHEIYSSDQSIYPAPLTYDRLKSWVDACPELTVAYQVPNDEAGKNLSLAGVVVILPIQANYWKDVLGGNLKETDILPSHFVTNDQAEEEVGLHIFHIEKYEAWDSEIRKYTTQPSFAKFALQDAREVAKGKEWKVIGYSGMCSFSYCMRGSYSY